MKSKFNPKCITYSVDPNALKAGVPIENLEKQNIRVYDRPETMDDLNRYLSSNKRLFDEPGRYRIPQPPEKPKEAPTTKHKKPKEAPKTKRKKPKGCPPQILEIYLESADFLRVSRRQIIKIPNTVKIGNKFCLVDKTTLAWMVKTLHSVVGDYGYWV